MLTKVLRTRLECDHPGCNNTAEVISGLGDKNSVKPVEDVSLMSIVQNMRDEARVFGWTVTDEQEVYCGSHRPTRFVMSGDSLHDTLNDQGFRTVATRVNNAYADFICQALNKLDRESSASIMVTNNVINFKAVSKEFGELDVE